MLVGSRKGHVPLLGKRFSSIFQEIEDVVEFLSCFVALQAAQSIGIAFRVKGLSECRNGKEKSWRFPKTNSFHRKFRFFFVRQP